MALLSGIAEIIAETGKKHVKNLSKSLTLTPSIYHTCL